MGAIKKTLWVLLYWLRSILDPIFRFQEVVVLCYHSVSDSDFFTDITPQTFESHLELLKNRGYVFVPLADVVAWVRGEKTLPHKVAALTFDDGYADFENNVVPLLTKYHAPATVFVVGEARTGTTELEDDLPFLSEEAIAGLRQNPLVEIGWHSKTHPNLAKLSAEEVEREVASREHFFAYPGGNHSPAAVEALKRAGYEAAFTIRPVLTKRGSNPYLLPRVVVTKDMSEKELLARTSKAADWYWALKKFV